jgi:organic radical activating enzyme
MKRNIGFMDYGLFKKIADEFGHYKNRNLLICGLGEPVLHPQIKEILNYLSEKQIRHTFYTNGTFLKKFTIYDIVNWNIDTIVVSVDGLDNESYRKIRVGKEDNQYDVIKENVSALFRLRNREGKKNPRIEIRHVIFPNESNKQLVSFRDEWLKIADAVKFNFIISPSDKAFERTQNLRRCRDIRRKMHIRWSGQVPVCGYQYIHDDHEWMGDVNYAAIKEMWNHARLKKVRFYHKNRDFDSIPFCNKCVFTQT